MYNLSHRDTGCLISIIDSIDKIISYTKTFKSADEFYKSTISFDATMMNFIVIGEMAEKLSEEFRESSRSEIDWVKIKGFRNIIAHNYFGIDAEEVWQIIQDSLIDLRQKLTGITKQKL